MKARGYAIELRKKEWGLMAFFPLAAHRGTISSCPGKEL